MALPVGKVDVVMINNTDSAYTTGKYYRIERFENNGWIEIPRKFGSFEDIGYIIKPNGGKRSFTINLQNVQHTYQKEYIESVKKHEKAEINITYIALSILNKVIFPIYLKSKCCTLCNA